MREISLKSRGILQYAPTGIFLSFCLIIISISILGINALCTSPVLSFHSKSPLSITEYKLHKIENIELDPAFSLRLPEFFFPNDEAKWWQMQYGVYNVLINNTVNLEYSDKDEVIRNVKADVVYTTFIDVIKETGLIYLAGFIYLLSAVSVFRRHRSASGAILTSFLLSGSLYLISSAPVVSRQITLIPAYFRMLIIFDYISAGGMITLVHFAFVFPRPKEIVKRNPYLPYVIFYGYFLLTTLFYLLGISAFASSFPFLVLWIIVMLSAFTHSIMKEDDIFLRKQISLSLFAPLMAGGVFTLFNVLPGVLGATSMNFTYFALFSLILPYALPSAMDNLKLYKERLEMERDAQMEKERTRQELHDNLINDLTSIRFLSETAEVSMSNEPEKTRNNIEAIKEIALKNMQGLRDFLWAIDIEGKGMDDFLSHFKSYTSRLFDSLDIDIGFREVYSTKAPPLSTHIRFNLFNIFKEAITNIVKHSMAKNVMVDISYDEKTFEMKITDDGKGFNPEKNTDGSFGIKNMKKRVKDIGGILNIISKEGKGTEISLILPH